MGDSTAKSIVASAAFAEQQAKAEAARKEREAVYHTIKSGDILGKIASRYGVSIDQICKLNNISRNTVLRIGKRLRVK